MSWINKSDVDKQKNISVVYKYEILFYISFYANRISDIWVDDMNHPLTIWIIRWLLWGQGIANQFVNTLYTYKYTASSLKIGTFVILDRRNQHAKLIFDVNEVSMVPEAQKDP